MQDQREVIHLMQMPDSTYRNIRKLSLFKNTKQKAKYFLIVLHEIKTRKCKAQNVSLNIAFTSLLCRRISLLHPIYQPILFKPNTQTKASGVQKISSSADRRLVYKRVESKFHIISIWNRNAPESWRSAIFLARWSTFL